MVEFRIISLVMVFKVDHALETSERLEKSANTLSQQIQNHLGGGMREGEE
jgi:hypothetical protein